MGSSEAAVIVRGKHFETDVLTLWRRKVGLEGREDRQNGAMAMGRRYEPELRAWYEAVSGRKAPPVCCLHASHDWLRASLDGWVDATRTVVEIKYARAEYHADALAGAVPEAYVPQVEHQLLVTGAPRLHYVSYNPRFPAGEERALVTVRPDPARISALEKLLADFWRAVVERDPDLLPATAAASA